MANTSLQLTSLDFDTLKDEFKTYLKSQQKFADFDFEGSNINVLLTILAHNTFKNSFYLNMVAAESFLDSAQLIESVRSHAKELNYCPRSARSAKAKISLSFRTKVGINSVVIPKGTGFRAVSNFRSFTFTTAENLSLSSPTRTFSVTGLEIFEGSYVYDSYIMNYSDETQRFLITNEMIDVDSLSVTVIEDDGLTVKSYRRATTLLDLNSNSPVFFVQSGPKKLYEVIFGDGVLGRRPKDNAVIRLDYRISSGEAPNGAVKFSLNDDFSNGNLSGEVTVTTAERAADGSDPETLDSIKFNAPRHFQVQERAVTVDDYEVLLQTKFPEINALSVYGGEEVDPPQYGRVFVAVDIENVDGLPDAKKLEYYDFLKSRSPLSIDPVFVEPEYLYYSVDTLIKYNINLTTIKPEDISALVKDAIDVFNQTYLDDFKVKLRYSKFITDIDAAHESIVSNETTLKVYKKINPELETFQNFYLKFGLPIKDVRSSKFLIDGEISYIDDVNGVLWLVSSPRPGVTRRTKKVGSVNYNSGRVNVTNFRISGYLDSDIKIICTPADLDIASKQNQILTTESDQIRVTVQRVRE